MKKSELIEKLNAIEGDPDVCILDLRKNLMFASDEGTSEGIHEIVDIDHFPIVEPDHKEFITLSFHNDDYNEDGTLAEK
jgi:hypothetical protein